MPLASIPFCLGPDPPHSALPRPGNLSPLSPIGAEPTCTWQPFVGFPWQQAGQAFPSLFLWCYKHAFQNICDPLLWHRGHCAGLAGKYAWAINLSQASCFPQQLLIPSCFSSTRVPSLSGHDKHALVTQQGMGTWSDKAKGGQRPKHIYWAIPASQFLS